MPSLILISHIKKGISLMNIVKMLQGPSLIAALACAGFVSAPVSAAENPMDHVGQKHNLYLECLALSPDRKVSPLIRLVTECGVDPGMSAEDFAEKYQAAITSDPTLSMAERMKPYRASYTDREFAYFARFDKIANTAKTLGEAEAMLAELEAQAIAELDPKTHAGANILGGLSIARHSLAYWTKVGGGNPNVSAKGFWSWLWKKLAVVGADVVGGLIATEVGLGALAGEVGAAASDLVSDWVN
jgi:hypothetical protein